MSGKQYLDELLSNLNAFAGISQDRIAAIVEYVAEIERAAALSVPAAEVVGEPVAWTTQAQIDKFKVDPGCNAVMWGEPLPHHPDIPLYAAPSAPEGWQSIESAPKDGTEILAYGYARCDGSRYANGQHIAWWDAELGWTGRDPDDRVTLHPSHWQPLPIPPANGDSHE